MPSIAGVNAPAAPLAPPSGVPGAPNNFSNLDKAQSTAWAKQLWQTVRQKSFIMASAGTSFNNAIVRVTELTATSTGTQAIMTLVPDLESEGINGNGFLEGREKALEAEEQTITIDHLREAHKSKGRLSEQATVVRFRETARDKLAYWLADTIDQLAAMKLSGWSPAMTTNGKIRTIGATPLYTYAGGVWSLNTGAIPALTEEQVLAGLDFMRLDSTGTGLALGAADALSNNRAWRLEGATSSVPSNIVPGNANAATNFTSLDKISYGALVDFKAYLADRRLRVIQGDMGTAVFHVLVHPKVMAALKKDQDFLGNIRQGAPRSLQNSLFTGSIPTIDGLVFHEWTHCPNTLGAAVGTPATGGNPGIKWSTNATASIGGHVDGSRVIFLGSQALGLADLGAPSWDERDHFDYGDKPGIAVSKMFGMTRPRFTNIQDGSQQEFGVATLDVAI